MKKFSFLFLLFLCKGAISASVDTITVHSKVLGQDSKAVIVLPDSYAASSTQKYPVVYLLHGYTGDYSNWIKRVPQIKQYADLFQMILVCPDGKNSWYIDSKMQKGSEYESYIIKELIPFVDASFKTIPDRNKRGITGLSMGGHGALYLAIRHTDLFSSAGSMSGVLDLIPWKHQYGLEKLIGDTSSSVIALYSDIDLVSTADTVLSITIDCGISDPFISANRRMHQRLIELGVPHDYTERFGGHTWAYWRNAIEYQLLFFQKTFYGRE